jgi:hypothetical protein
VRAGGGGSAAAMAHPAMRVLAEKEDAGAGPRPAAVDRAAGRPYAAQSQGAPAGPPGATRHESVTSAKEKIVPATSTGRDQLRRQPNLGEEDTYMAAEMRARGGWIS